MRLRRHYSAPPSRPLAGFSMVEVMVALVVVSVGLLGIAKMQALALASTNTAKMRSIAAIQAASLASTMHADRAYWANLTSTQTVTIDHTGITAATDALLKNAAPAKCAVFTATPCTSVQLAAQDLSDWLASLQTALPNDTALITCTYDNTGVNPVTCSIQIRWTETVVALNTANNVAATTQANANALAAVAGTQYTLYIQP